MSYSTSATKQWIGDMTICSSKQQKVLTTASLHIHIVGEGFLFGDQEISFPGYATSAHRDKFLKVLRDGVAFLVTETKGGWELHRIKEEDESCILLSGDVVKLDIHGKERK